MGRGVRTEDIEKALNLPPKQALGEARACVERARVLLRSVIDGAAYSAASHAAFMALASVNDAWAQVTSAQAHLAAIEKKP